jgi:hypothetical protein
MNVEQHNIIARRVFRILTNELINEPFADRMTILETLTAAWLHIFADAENIDPITLADHLADGVRRRIKTNHAKLSVVPTAPE